MRFYYTAANFHLLSVPFYMGCDACYSFASLRLAAEERAVIIFPLNKLFKIKVSRYS